MEKIILVLSLLVFSLADIKVNYASFNDSSTYIIDSGLRTSFLSEGVEYSANIDSRKTPSMTTTRYHVGGDWDYTEKLSGFWFIDGVEKGTTRIGYGVGNLLSDKILQYPWGNKISIALVNDSSKGTIASIRHKFVGYSHGVGVQAITFLMGYTYTIDYRIKFEINKDYSLIIKGYADDAAKINQASVGAEFSL